MSDPRVNDAIRQIPEEFKYIVGELKQIREDNNYMKDMLRDIKKSVVRKYTVKEEPTKEEPPNA